MVVFLFNVFVIRIGGCGMEFVTVFAIQMSPVALEVVIIMFWGIDSIHMLHENLLPKNVLV